MSEDLQTGQLGSCTLLSRCFYVLIQLFKISLRLYRKLPSRPLQKRKQATEIFLLHECGPGRGLVAFLEVELVLANEEPQQ